MTEEKIKQIEELNERYVDFRDGSLSAIESPVEEMISSKATPWSIPTIAYRRAIKDVLEILRA